MRWMAIWMLVAVALAVAGCVAGRRVPHANADERQDEPTEEERTFAAVRTLIRTLATTEDGPVPGVRRKKALPLVASWSQIITDWMAPLEASPYAPGPGWKGIVRVYLDDEATDDLSVHLLVLGIDRAALRAFVPQVLTELGYEVFDDDENRWSLWGTAPGRRDAWIGVGEGVLSVEVSMP